MSYYQRNKQLFQEQAQEHYHDGGGKEKSARLFSK